jgi:hypothetical protein
LLLAGCSDADWSHVMSYDDYPPRTAAPDAPAPSYANVAAVTAAPSDTDRCNRVAEERMTDADYQGFDAPMQQQVRDKTYADCLAWAAGHSAK